MGELWLPFLETSTGRLLCRASGGQGTVYQKAGMAPFSSLEARLQHCV